METVERVASLSNTNVVYDSTISMVNNESSEATLAEVVLPSSSNPQPTNTESCGESEMVGEIVLNPSTQASETDECVGSSSNTDIQSPHPVQNFWICPEFWTLEQNVQNIVQKFWTNLRWKKIWVLRLF